MSFLRSVPFGCFALLCLCEWAQMGSDTICMYLKEWIFVPVESVLVIHGLHTCCSAYES